MHKEILIALGTVLLAMDTVAQPQFPLPIEMTLSSPHTSRTIVVKNKNQSGWKFSISALSEQNLVEFTDVNDNPISPYQWFPITDSFKYFFSFQPGADFDILYAVTAINEEHDALQQGNPKCTFIFTGLRPAVPENYVSNFANANCVLERDKLGNLNLVLDKN